MKYGRYQIIRELSREGGMGVVYLAHDPNLDLSVALKVLRQDRIASEDFVLRFVDEAKALGRLDHSNIVRVYNVDEDGGTVYIVMEFIEGEPLHKVMEKRKFSVDEIVKLGVEIADALDYAHQRGIVHRDIKPSNVLIRTDGRIKITDFGIAHIEDLKKTQTGDILGTPLYMSPEQVKGLPIDGRTDLFSLGIVLYELSTGERPFKGENRDAIFHAIVKENPVEPSKINAAVPKTLSQIIMKCLGKNPEKRFKTGKALAESLITCLGEKKTEERILPTWKKFFLLMTAVIVFAGIGYGVIPKIIFHPPPDVVLSSLNVESIPDGAQVFVDGNFKGRTPTKLDLPLGKHEVRLKLADYFDWEAQVELKERAETPLEVRLIPTLGK
jgi:serine/threonine protein kinase